MREYDLAIQNHYKKVAEESGLSPSSTMEDEITRAVETKAILQFVGECLRQRQSENVSSPATIMDVGCGNGYTLSVISEVYPGQIIVGVEKSDELRALALSRFEGMENVVVLEGDVRESGFQKAYSAEILICQRVIINLLDIEDQKLALNNIIASVRTPNAPRGGGKLLFIEAFHNPLGKLNEARSEFRLPPISPAHHNLYLGDDFFDTPQLKPFLAEGGFLPPNFLSTHYFVTRVLHPVIAKDSSFKRNSEFVRFFSEALKPNVGDYSPLRLNTFERI